jgi:hypothetical protein
VACLVAALTTLCPGAKAESISLPELNAIHVIGIFSKLGDEAEIKKVGFTVFGNRHTKLNIADWQINKLVTTEAANALSGQFQVKIPAFDTPVRKDDKESIFHNLIGPGESPFLAMPQSGLDAYLVFVPSSEDFPYPSNQSVEGLGMVHDPRSSSDQPGTHPAEFDGTIFAQRHPTAAVVYAIYNIFLVDAKSGRVIALQQAEIPTRYHQTLGQMLWYGVPYSPIRYPHPHEYVASGIWADTAEDLTEPQQQAMKTKLTSLIKSSVGYSLSLMGLTSVQVDNGQTSAQPGVNVPASAPASPPTGATPPG